MFWPMGGWVLWSCNLTCLYPWVWVSGHLTRPLLYTPVPTVGKAERQLEKQTRTTEGKMAQGSAFPVKWQVHSPFVKLSRAGWTPEGPRVCIQLVSSTTSATSALWPELELPSDSGLATLLHRGESHVPVLICSAQKCPSAPLLRASASTLPENVGTRQHSSKRQRTADAWKKKSQYP